MHSNLPWAILSQYLRFNVFHCPCLKISYMTVEKVLEIVELQLALQWLLIHIYHNSNEEL